MHVFHLNMCVFVCVRLTCPNIVTCLVHSANEKLQANNGIYDYDKHDQQTNMKQRNHCLHDGVQHNLQAYTQLLHTIIVTKFSFAHIPIHMYKHTHIHTYWAHQIPSAKV